MIWWRFQTGGNMEKSERFELRIEPQLKKDAEIVAANRGTTVAELIREYLRRVAKKDQANKKA